MIWPFARIGRAEALAAVALVVGARQEPITGFRRLAAEDPGLTTLSALADRCAGGMTLPDALATARLVTRAQARQLAGLAPEALAEELTRIAQRTVSPSAGEILARWLPVWMVLAASLPSLVIGAAVALVGDAAYGGIWQGLGLAPAVHAPACLWFVQAGAMVVLAFATGACWWLLRHVPLLRHLTIFSPTLERAAALMDVLRAARAGGDTHRLVDRLIRLSGDRASLRRAWSQSSGDATTMLIAVGAIPRTSQGRPDWEAAVAEVDHARAVAVTALSPLLVAALVSAGIYGLISWGTFAVIFNNGAFSFFGYGWNIQLSLGQGIAGTLIALYFLLTLRWLWRCLVGSVVDWPLVADRLARAIDRREDMAAVLRGLRLVVGWPMRFKIDDALALDPSHLPKALVQAGVVPKAYRRILAAADGADLPTLLRRAGEIVNDHGISAAVSQVWVVMGLALMLVGFEGYLLIGIMPKEKHMYDGHHLEAGIFPSLFLWAYWGTLATCAAVAIGSMIVTWGQSRGWWAALGGWARLARGMVLRRMLVSGANEAQLARAMRSLASRPGPRLDAAAERGDLPGLLAAAGWPVASPAALDRALAAEFVARDRRHARVALIVRLTLPFLVAAPVALTASGVTLMLTGLTRWQVELATGRPNGSSTLSGGTPGMALIYWWSARCEAQGDAAIERARADAALVAPAIPAPTKVHR